MCKSVTYSLFIFLSAALASGCSSLVMDDAGTTPDYAALLNAAERSAPDTERDATSSPAAILAFYGVQPGMKIADIFSGGGYYSEVLAHVVGPRGQVIAHNNSPYAQFAGDAPAQRYANDRLDNVQYVVTETKELALPGNLDMVFMVMSFHDTYWVNDDQGWPKIDNQNFNRQLFASLKSGGTLAIIDHSAVAGTGIEAVADLHRIDEAFVVTELEAAGFRLEDTSDLLRNPEDDRSKLVFDEDIRRKTDRFILRFTKP